MKKRFYSHLIIVVALLLSGCAGYQLGTSTPNGIQTVALTSVINKTGEPAVEQQITHALRERIQFDGRLQLAGLNDSPDGIIEVTLTRYTLNPIAYRNIKSATPQLYRLSLWGNAELKSTQTGESIGSTETYGENQVPFQSDLTSAKRDALPAAADEFAKYLLDDLIEQW